MRRLLETAEQAAAFDGTLLLIGRVAECEPGAKNGDVKWVTQKPS